MTRNKVLVVGENRLAEELRTLSESQGFETLLQSQPEATNASFSVAVETIAGNEEEKRAVLRKLDTALGPSTPIVSSCLGFSTTRIASWTARPQRIVGFATFYPLKEKKLIELTTGLRGDADALAEAERFFRALGKETITVKDGPGLTFPRILSLIVNEAARTLDEEVANAEEIDIAMRLGVNYPSGPLRWADQIALDEVLAVLEGLHRDTGDDRYRPAPLLKQMVLAGWLGEQSGRGFYSYK
ncbi:MAG: 3-hydroxyacyl-CoA dehydrogenase family protein [Candidatus Binatia bacterium]